VCLTCAAASLVNILACLLNILASLLAWECHNDMVVSDLHIYIYMYFINGSVYSSGMLSVCSSSVLSVCNSSVLIVHMHSNSIA
jgi:hypothetical protein